MNFKDTFFSGKLTINCKGRIIDLSVPRVMGIINITTDSFYENSRNITKQDILSRMSQMLSDGADIIDVGAVSSRPGAAEIDSEFERDRLKMALQVIRREFPQAVLSVDTFRSEIAEYVVREFGVDMINDISAGVLDKQMLSMVGTLKVPYIMMHMQGTPQTMQINPAYGDIVKELIAFFAERSSAAHKAGIIDVIIDPGFGFGKTVQHNFQLLKELDLFKVLHLPVMVGLSRKSMIYKSLGILPGDALNGTTVLNTLALNNGANLLRVHDVKEAVEAIKLVTIYRHT
jgi:dihydropteroate synthase